MEQHYPDWATSPLMRDYYANEWGRPVHGEDELYGLFCLELFQAGLKWESVLKRRAALTAAFADFSIEEVARFDAARIDLLCQNAAIIRNRMKITACVHNAQLLAEWHQAGKYFSPFLWAYNDGQPERLVPAQDGSLPATTPKATALAKEMKKAGFAFAGPKVVFSLLCAAGIVNGRLD